MKPIDYVQIWDVDFYTRLRDQDHDGLHQDHVDHVRNWHNDFQIDDTKREILNLLARAPLPLAIAIGEFLIYRHVNDHTFSLCRGPGLFVCIHVLPQGLRGLQ